jgi:hypothetical protein
MLSLTYAPAFQPSPRGATHLEREIRAELSQVGGLTDGGNPLFRPSYWQPALALGEHLVELGMLQLMVSVLKDDEFLVETLGHLAVFLLFGGVAEDQHADRENILRQVE